MACDIQVGDVFTNKTGTIMFLVLGEAHGHEREGYDCLIFSITRSTEIATMVMRHPFFELVDGDRRIARVPNAF